MPKSSLSVSLKGADDIFSTEESRQEQQREQVQQIPIGELFPFKDHPFKVLDDESMQRTVESVEQYGVLSPLIARPRPEGGYEIISGHRRKHAAELANLDTVPVIVRNMEDDAATILMVDSNLQREHILPSERAFAYKMKLDAIKNQGAILDRQEYLGHTVLCKSIRENFKLKKRRAATPEERIIFKNTHEAIIDQETWDKAQRLRKRNPKKLPSGTYSHRLAGMVFCADCGSRMSFSSPESKHRDSDIVYDSDSSWQCSKYRNMYVSCTSHFTESPG